MVRLVRTRRRGLRTAALVLSVAALAGCASRQAVSANEDLFDPVPPVAARRPALAGILNERDRGVLASLVTARAAMPGESGYRLGPDDLLDVRIPDLLEAQVATAALRSPTAGSAALPQVAEAPAFQQGVRIDALGDVTLPLLGTVHAAGRTPAELEREIAQRLVAGGILRRPQPTVQVAEYRSRVIAVVGSVERPGLYPVTRPGMTLADAVLAAGGPSKDAGRIVAFVPSRGEALPPPGTVPSLAAALHLDLDGLLHPAGPDARLLNPIVRAGDLVSLQPAGNVQVDGWVDKPGSYPATRGLTVSGAVAAAGGELFAADLGNVVVQRAGGTGDARRYVVDLHAVSRGDAADLPLADGDVVRLSASPVRLVPWGLWQVAREMIHVGGSVALF